MNLDSGTLTVTALVVYVSEAVVTVTGPVIVVVNVPVHGIVVVESPAVGVSITTKCLV